MSHEKIEVGDFVSTDHCFCKTPGCLPTSYGRESRDCRFQVGTIYNDANSSFIWVENQVSLGRNENVKVKSRFEKWLWDQDAAKFYHYQGKNIIFTAADCQHDFNKKGKTHSFYGVSAQH